MATTVQALTVHCIGSAACATGEGAVQAAAAFMLALCLMLQPHIASATCTLAWAAQTMLLPKGHVSTIRCLQIPSTPCNLTNITGLGVWWA